MTTAGLSAVCCVIKLISLLVISVARVIFGKIRKENRRKRQKYAAGWQLNGEDKRNAPESGEALTIFYSVRCCHQSRSEATAHHQLSIIPSDPAISGEWPRPNQAIALTLTCEDA